jgi:PAS domain S-box-containing protein
VKPVEVDEPKSVMTDPGFDADAILDAIRNNEIDALVIRKGASERVFALRSIEELRQADTELKHAGVERRLANAARRELEKRFETLATHAPIGIFMNDVNGQCVYVNRRACEIIGKSSKEALGGGLVDTLHPEDRDAFFRERSSAAARGMPFATEVRYCRPDGQIVWVASKSVALPAAAGKSTGRIGTMSDITEQKRAEIALRESRHNLQALLEQRERLTQDLHDGCIQSIYAIGLNLQSCRQMLEGHPEAAKIVGKSAANLNLVIHELRAFISGTGAAVKPDFELEIERAGQTGRDVGIAFAMDVDKRLANALPADQALHLLQIAREAISNAVRHAKAKSIEVRLGPSNNLACLEICDDGVGFDMKKLKHIGLGLHHIEARARALQGTSKIVSTSGKGTRIEVRLPLPR